MQYEFLAPQRIVFGWEKRFEVGELAASLGRRALMVVGSQTLERTAQVQQVRDRLQEQGISSTIVARISREPLVEDVDAATEKLEVQPGDFVLAIGGGSALDLGKALSAMATNRHGNSVQDFLEGVGRGLQLQEPPLPMLAMPTTSGTGSEATKNAVISSLDPPFKKSLRSNALVPDLVLIDPELSVSVPAKVTAATGMDTITQLIESYLSRRAAPIPQALAVQGLARAFPYLPIAVREPENRPAREAMAHAALLSGMALANSGLGLAHGVAAALGVHAGVSHGLACAVMLPVAMKVNREVRQIELAELAHLMDPVTRSLSQSEAADAAIAKIENLCRELEIPSRLSELGLTAEQIPALVRSSHGNSFRGNPKQVSDPELTELLERML